MANQFLSLNDILNVYFRSAGQTPNFYIGLIDAVNFTGISATDTMAAHPGWQENTDYSEGSRPQWSPSAASGGELLNASAMNFTMNLVSSIAGFFLTSSNTKGGTSGTLFAAGVFAIDPSTGAPVPVAMPSGEVLKGFYDLVLANA